MTGPSLSELFGGIAKPDFTYPDHEAAIQTLREKYAVYTGPFPFTLGQLVTPIAGAYIHGTGQPHIVVEIFDTPIRPTDGENGSASQGFHARLDMRVIGISGGGSICGWMVESWQFEPYVPRPSRLRKKADA